jgi:prevent-host-death family protein
LLPFRPAQRLALENLYIDVYKRILMTELTISEARKALLDLPEKLARTPERAVTITRRGQPVLAILPWAFYESIVETLESSRTPRWSLRCARVSRTSSGGAWSVMRRPRSASAYEHGSRFRDHLD